jgi:hypothetical protein
MPFVAVMAAGMAARAKTGSFEWLYGLRIVAVAISLWLHRATYKSINWRFDWTAHCSRSAHLRPLDRARSFRPWPDATRTCRVAVGSAIHLARAKCDRRHRHRADCRLLKN